MFDRIRHEIGESAWSHMCYSEPCLRDLGRPYFNRGKVTIDCGFLLLCVCFLHIYRLFLPSDIGTTVSTPSQCSCWFFILAREMQINCVVTHSWSVFSFLFSSHTSSRLFFLQPSFLIFSHHVLRKTCRLFCFLFLFLLLFFSFFLVFSIFVFLSFFFFLLFFLIFCDSFLVQ